MKSRKHTFPVYLSLSDDQLALLTCCASDLGIPFHDVLQAVANTALRVHLERCEKYSEDDTEVDPNERKVSED